MPYQIDHLKPNDHFPPVHLADTEPNGLLAIGGDLSIDRILNAYRSGIFPWFNPDEPILWWSPNPRTILLPSEVKISKSLKKSIRKHQFTVSFDQCFKEVIQACAGPRKIELATWITHDIQQAYIDLHQAGHAHSVETWYQGELVGGLYGIAIGKVFYGESMFAHKSDASKVALVHLAGILQKEGYQLIDCQVYSAHLASLGAVEIEREDFIQIINQLNPLRSEQHHWHKTPTSPIFPKSSQNE